MCRTNSDTSLKAKNYYANSTSVHRYHYYRPFLLVKKNFGKNTFSSSIALHQFEGSNFEVAA